MKATATGGAAGGRLKMSGRAGVVAAAEAGQNAEGMSGGLGEIQTRDKRERFGILIWHLLLVDSCAVLFYSVQVSQSSLSLSQEWR
jgi:hypothetical protein